MYLARYRLTGDPAELRARHAALVAEFGGDVQLQVTVERPDGLDVYDACPSEARFREFSASAEFRDALARAGLPVPQVEGLGEIVHVTVPREAALQ